MASEVAIVTGGAYEEGLSVADALLRAGKRVSIWDTDAQELKAAVAELRALGLDADAREVDLGSPAAVSAAYEDFLAENGVPDALFNMATLKNSFLQGDPEERAEEHVPFWELDWNKLARVVEVNVLGTLFCSAAVAPGMVARGSGSIVNFSTSDSTKRSPEHIPYGPSKAMVEAFSAALASELAPQGIRVNVIASGGRVNRRGRDDPRYVPAMWACELVSYLMSSDSASVTGKRFRGGGLEPVGSLLGDGEKEAR